MLRRNLKKIITVLFDKDKWTMPQAKAWMKDRFEKKKTDLAEKDVPIVKVDDDKRLVYGVVYAPYETDAQEDWMSPEEIEKAAHVYMTEYRKLRKNHEEDLDDCYVVESYIAPSAMRIGNKTVTEGSWVMVTKINNDEVWADIKSGKITGYSMAGNALRVPDES